MQCQIRKWRLVLNRYQSGHLGEETPAVRDKAPLGRAMLSGRLSMPSKWIGLSLLSMIWPRAGDVSPTIVALVARVRSRTPIQMSARGGAYKCPAEAQRLLLGLANTWVIAANQ
jgi:hypothetical protein